MTQKKMPQYRHLWHCPKCNNIILKTARYIADDRGEARCSHCGASVLFDELKRKYVGDKTHPTQ